MDTLTGSNADPEYRSKRARQAAFARHSLDTYIDSIERRADELTDAQALRLRKITFKPESHKRSGGIPVLDGQLTVEDM